MTLEMTCKRCGTAITAEDEDELVTQVKAHAAGHGRGPALSREHILSRLHRLQRQHSDEA